MAQQGDCCRGPAIGLHYCDCRLGNHPLAIKISSQGYSPLAAVSMRFVLATILACMIVALVSHHSGLKRKHWKAYAVASFAIFPNMPLVFTATTYISSGLVSVMFATAPLIMGVL